MTEAITLPIFSAPTAPAISAAQTVGASESGEGFAAALAQLLGVGPATPANGAPTQLLAQGSKVQGTRNTTTPNAQPDAVSATAPPMSILAASVAVPPVAATNVPQIGTIGEALRQAAKLETAEAAPATAAATVATDTLDPTTAPETASSIQTLAAVIGDSNTLAAAIAPGTALKTAPKTAPPKQAGAASTPATATSEAPNGEVQSTAADKPASTTPVTSFAQHTKDEGSNNSGSQSQLGKPVATAPQSTTPAAPVVFTVHSIADTQMATAPAQIAAAAIVPVDALAVHIARKFEAGESRFEIRLDPIELGKLDISVTVTDDGRVQAVVRAERAETLDLLQRDARLLESQLRQSGLNVDSNSLSFSLGQGSRHAFGEKGSPFARALLAGSDSEKPATISTAIVSVRDGIDIRI